MRLRCAVSLLAAIGIWSFATFAKAQTSPSAEGKLEASFTESDAIAAMRRAHPLLRAAGASIRVAEGNAITAGHWSNPLLDASYYKAVRNSSYDVIGTPAVGVTQFIEVAGAPAARRRSAQSEVEATRADRESVARDLEWDVREAFVRLAVSEEKRKFRRDAVADLERAAGIVRARVASGMVPRYDGSRIQLALEQVRADLANAEAEAVRARGDLDVAVGPAAGDLHGAPRFDPLDVRPPPRLPDVLDAARTSRPDLVAARRRTDAAETDIDVAKRSIMSGFALRLGAGFGQAPGQLDFGGGVIVPLPLLERGQGSVAAAEARADGNRHLTDALTTAVNQRVRAAHAEYVKRAEAVARFRSETSSVSDSMRNEAEAGYREAKLSVLELVDAYYSARDARLRLLELAESAHLSRIALGRAIGVSDPSR